MPSLFRALAVPDPEGRAKALVEVAQAWFDCHQWLYEESVVCTAFYYGAQYGYWSSEEGAYIAFPAQRMTDQLRVTVNLTKPIADAATGILTQEEPIFRPRAATKDGEDSGAQNASEAFTEFYWRSHKLRQMYRLSGRRAFTNGTVGVGVYWDKSAGPLAPEMDAQFVERADGDPLTMGTKLGDLAYRLFAEDQIAFDPASMTPYDGLAITVRERYSRASFDETFGAEFRQRNEERPDESERPHDTREASRSSPVGYSYGIYDNVSSDYDGTMEGLLTVYTTFVRSCEQYPRGLMIQYTDRQVLYEGVNPRYPAPGEPDALWPTTPWPIFFARADHREQCPWGRGRVVDMIETQRSLNGTVSKMLQHAAKVGNAKVAMPNNLNVEWSDEIGQVLRLGRTHQMSQIGYISPAQLGPEFDSLLDRLQTYMEYQAGTNSSTMGFSGADVNSGRQENIRIQRDYGRLGPIKRDLDDMWGEIMAYTLQLFRRHASGERKVIVAGRNNQTSVQFFDRTSFASDVDIVVENNQSLPRDPTERAVALNSIFQTLGALPPHMQGPFLDLHRVNDLEPFLDRANPDLVKARRLTHRLLLGEPTPIFEGDDPLIFKMELERLIKGEEFEVQVRNETASMGVSPLEQMAMAAWLYYTSATAPPVAGPEQPGVPGEPAPMPAAEEAVPADPQPQEEPAAA